MKNQGWWCLIVDRDCNIMPISSFGCSKNEFYNFVIDTYSPIATFALNPMRLKRKEQKMMKEINKY
jgi:hypothetical protein